MEKTWLILVAVGLILLFWGVGMMRPGMLIAADSLAAELFAGGSGTLDDPYLIMTAEQLTNMAEFGRAYPERHQAAHYALVDDIDFGSRPGPGRLSPLANDCNDPILGTPDSPFPAPQSIDGQGQIISNWCNDSPDSSYIAYFGYVRPPHDTAVIRDFYIKNFTVRGDSYVGSLFSDVEGVRLKNIKVIGSDVQGKQIVGGLAGKLNQGSIQHSLVQAVVEGETSVGPIVGKFTNSSDTGNFWNSDLFNNQGEQAAPGAGRTTVELRNMNTFKEAGWDIGGTAVYDFERQGVGLIGSHGFPYLTPDTKAYGTAGKDSPVWLISNQLTLEITGQGEVLLDGVSYNQIDTRGLVPGDTIVLQAVDSETYPFLRWTVDPTGMTVQQDTELQLYIDPSENFYRIEARFGEASDDPIVGGLNDFIVGPNPFRYDEVAEEEMKFKFDQVGVGPYHLEIYTITGGLVYSTTTDDDPYNWDLRNNAGDRLSSGHYIYQVTQRSTGDTRRGRLAIVR